MKIERTDTTFVGMSRFGSRALLRSSRFARVNGNSSAPASTCPPPPTCPCAAPDVPREMRSANAQGSDTPVEVLELGRCGSSGASQEQPAPARHKSGTSTASSIPGGVQIANECGSGAPMAARSVLAHEPQTVFAWMIQVADA